MAAYGYSGMGGEWIQMLAVDAFLMGCTDKRSARSALDRDPKTVDEALEEVYPVAPQVNRVQEERSSSLDVGELNENIEKLTKLLANMNMAGPSPPCAPIDCTRQWVDCCCCLPTPITLDSWGCPIFPLVVEPGSPSIWPAVHSLRRGCQQIQG